MQCGRTICALICALSASTVSAGNLLALTNPAQIAEERGIYLSGTAFLANDFAPIHEVRADLRDDYAPRDGRNLALVAARVESGFAWQGFRIGALYRQEWLGSAQRETLDLYRANRLLFDHEVGATTPIDYRLGGFAARGLQLGKAQRFSMDSGWAITLGVNGSLLQGQKLRQEQWSGNALATAAHSLSFSGNAMRVWASSGFDDITNTFVPAYRFGAPGGNGYSFDLGMHVEREDGAFIEWTVADAISRMHWTSIPQITYSGSGVYNGSFPEGKKWRINFDERLPVKQALLLSIPVRPVNVELADSVLRGNHFPTIGLRKEYSYGMSAQMDYDFRFRTVGIGLAYRAFHIGFRTDTIKLAQAHAYGLDMGIKFDF
ncbi:MAG: hypothetical protein PHQ05_08385 [Sterolibacterium sp.]|nr:hypothetical protein [Sterolibacterium sp.]